MDNAALNLFGARDGHTLAEIEIRSLKSVAPVARARSHDRSQ